MIGDEDDDISMIGDDEDDDADYEGDGPKKTAPAHIKCCSTFMFSSPTKRIFCN